MSTFERAERYAHSKWPSVGMPREMTAVELRRLMVHAFVAGSKDRLKKQANERSTQQRRAKA